jgi:glycopeptide antibiotics resistance protein
MLRYIVFLTFIILGFLLSRSSRHNGCRTKAFPAVLVIYLIALFYYTFLSRMELATTTEAVVATSAPVVQHWWVNAAYEIFRMKTSSYREAFILNIMLFVPMGYLLRTKRWWSSLLICSAVSLTIEILQQLTGFGMFDWNDWIANTVGSLLGVLVLWTYQKITTAV